jgi:hypothetical protein
MGYLSDLTTGAGAGSLSPMQLFRYNLSRSARYASIIPSCTATSSLTGLPRISSA